MKSWLNKNISKIKGALFKTKSVITETEAPSEKITINEDFYDDLFEKFLRSDMGFDFSEKLVKSLKENIKSKELEIIELNSSIKTSIKELINYNPQAPSSTPTIYLIVGVNGSGKTTSIGKLANKLKTEGKKVLIVAGDTFRAAAGEQIDLWSKKVGVDVFFPPDVKKPDAVIYNALEKSKNEGYNSVLIDTAGRLHSQKNLMEELKKINSVIEKQAGNMSIQKLIVLDSTIGQNAISQAQEFSNVINLTGIILSKLDSSAKGGVVLNIMNDLSLPVQYIGTGEKMDDIETFDFNDYLDGLLS